jgi:hypothetical protein
MDDLELEITRLKLHISVSEHNNLYGQLSEGIHRMEEKLDRLERLKASCPLLFPIKWQTNGF